MRTRAFTLVELLVVIGIIALLMGVLLPALNRARQSANNLKCMANLRSIGQAINIYTTQHKQSLPFGFWDGSDPLGSAVNNDKRTDWRVLLLTVLTRQSSNTYVENAAAGGDRSRISTDVFVDPDVPDNVGVLTYGCHPRLMPTINLAEPRILNFTGKRVYPKPYKIGKIKRAAEILLIADGTLAQIAEVPSRPLQSNATLYTLDHGAWNGGPPSSGTPPSYLLDDYSSAAMLNFPPNSNVDIGYGNTPTNARVNFDPAAPSSQLPANWGNLRFRHLRNTAANVLMVDGHVETHTYTVGSTRAYCTLKRLNVNVNPQ